MSRCSMKNRVVSDADRPQQRFRYRWWMAHKSAHTAWRRLRLLSTSTRSSPQQGLRYCADRTLLPSYSVTFQRATARRAQHAPMYIHGSESAQRSRRPTVPHSHPSRARHTLHPTPLIPHAARAPHTCQSTPPQQPPPTRSQSPLRRSQLSLSVPRPTDLSLSRLRHLARAVRPRRGIIHGPYVDQRRCDHDEDTLQSARAGRQADGIRGAGAEIVPTRVCEAGVLPVA